MEPNPLVALFGTMGGEADAPAALSIRPDQSQFFRYESFTMDCAVPGNGTGWTVKRNTPSKLVVCEDGWGRPNGSSCFKQSVYTSDTGLYWCESKWGECSNVLNITVNVGVVILESPALPVAAGDQVTLRCSYKERYAPRPSSDFNAVFYKNGFEIENSSDGTLTLPRLSKADEGLYKCKHPTEGESPESFLAVRASLRVNPVRSQFFEYESFSLICEQQGSPAEDWRVKRSTAFHQEEYCPPFPSRGHGPNCSLNDVYYSDSGVYWCESAAGRCSNAINITVASGSVILEGPVHPVAEGEALTLRCRTRAPSSNLTYFYKDDLLVGNSTSGNLTIRRVSPNDEGLYKCSVAGLGPSPGSWLAVRGRTLYWLPECDVEVEHGYYWTELCLGKTRKRLQPATEVPALGSNVSGKYKKETNMDSREEERWKKETKTDSRVEEARLGET
ncbi:sialoadhesin-like [Cololabis saira]|uniref:sialoadhesin-like n=1 Tax=Cololabis saira TaxID=129043 RepID=UPI002AD22F42|nr:sialoadhesin-like [Cololabis saira]